MIDQTAKIYVAGHRGLVGRAIVRLLESQGFSNLLISKIDLRDQLATNEFFRAHRPEYVFLAAARVGGILANVDHPGQFIYDNLAISLNVIHAAKIAGVKKLLNLGSSCIYPPSAPQPMRPEDLMCGPPEPTNRPYAIAKIAAIELCDAYRREYGMDFLSAMPTNLYGPGDNFDPLTSHVIPAMIRKFCDARERGSDAVTLWGSGAPLREFLYVEDLAEACLILMEHVSEEGPINIGSEEEISIADLAARIAVVAGYSGEIVWDKTMPDGAPRKTIDSSRIRREGWKPRVRLAEGLSRTVAWYRIQSQRRSPTS